MATCETGLYLLSVSNKGSQIYIVEFSNIETAKSTLNTINQHVSNMENKSNNQNNFDSKTLYKQVSNHSRSSDADLQRASQISLSSIHSSDKISSPIIKLKKSHSMLVKKYHDHQHQTANSTCQMNFEKNVKIYKTYLAEKNDGFYYY